MKELTIFVSDEQAAELRKMISIKRSVDAFHPEFDAVDRVAMTILAGITRCVIDGALLGCATVPSERQMQEAMK